MSHLENISTSELRTALDDVDDVHATKRLMLAIAYKQGVAQTDVAEWYGYLRKTIYNWLHRFEEEPVRDAARDKARPDRPPKLDREEQFKVAQLLRDPPANVGYNIEEWDIPRVQRLLDEQFDVTYSRTNAYRLLSKFE
ncbi:helix-turn-helix domain-containing protein [Haladaptatus halobius]|uniref:helix-turn-helix domain-containing protein n=1 Tax=Haladaptatus halobius TaxID=2884875 RepID=UPI001D0AA4BA|nr:helix-turn-helix domain-containing protein [Haladaptatus halobius]